MTPSEELYRLGFIDKCAELGVDFEELLKRAGVATSTVLALYALLKGVQKKEKETPAQGKAEKSPAEEEAPAKKEQQPAPEKESAASEDYIQGFIDKCAELGVDFEELAKQAGVGQLLLALGLGGVPGGAAGGAAGAHWAESSRLPWELLRPPLATGREKLKVLLGAAGGATAGTAGIYALLRAIEKMKETPAKKEQEQPAPEKEGAVLEDYTLGFIDKCAELGVDPEKLIKWASKLRQPARTGAALDPGAGPTPPVPPVVAQPNPGLMSKLLSGRGAGGLGPGLRGLSRGMKPFWRGLTSAP